MALTKKDIQAATESAKAMAQSLLVRAKKLQADWIDLYADILTFEKSIIGTRYEWELAGYKNVTGFRRAMQKALGDSESSYKAKMNTIRRLPKETIRKLGKVKAFQASRLHKAGKLTKENLQKLEDSPAEQAPRLVKKMVRPTEESRVPLTFNLVESQFDMVNGVLDKVMRVCAFQTKEDAVDKIFGRYTDMSDHEILMEFEFGQKDAVPPVGATA